MNRPPRVLSIAGSDSSGGAGIQADIKTITQLGGYAMTAITAVTAQNTIGVQAVELLPPNLVIAQIDSCLSDIGADAVKIGMLGSPETALAVADRLERVELPIVFDPVMVATSGAVLADEATITAFDRLMQRATLVTPNLPELEALTGAAANTPAAIRKAARTLAEKSGSAVLAKGGHGESETIADVLVRPDGAIAQYECARIDSEHTHGTGCTLASAITTMLGVGETLESAIARARNYVQQAIENAPRFGSGTGPVGPGT